MLSSIISAILSGENVGLTLAVQFCALLFLVVCCFPVHESAHAWMANRLGDPTGRLKGRISMNPLDHLDLIGTVMMFLFGFGYAKPVPVNINNLKHQKRDFALIAVAGPVSNLLLAVLFTLILYVIKIPANATLRAEGDITTLQSVALLFFTYAAGINVRLAVFNLIPVPPLDGSRVLTALLPDRIYYRLMDYERYMMWGLIAVIFLFNRLGFSPVSIVSGWISNGIDWLVGLPFQAFLS